MDHEAIRMLKIVNELTNFSYKLGASQLQIDLKEIEDRLEIIFQCNTKENVDELIVDLKSSLDMPRQEQVEEYLWEMVGEGEGYDELNLVGMMIDKNEVVYTDNKLMIRVERRKH